MIIKEIILFWFLGHGSLVSTPGGETWYLYHAWEYGKNRDPDSRSASGRQLLLDQVIWDNQTGWPRIGRPSTGYTASPDSSKRRECCHLSAAYSTASWDCGTSALGSFKNNHRETAFGKSVSDHVVSGMFEVVAFLSYLKSWVTMFQHSTEWKKCDETHSHIYHNFKFIFILLS